MAKRHIKKCSASLLIYWAFLMAQTVKNQPAMQETRVWSLGQEDLLEKGIAIHSSILAWRIPWTEEPGALQSMRSQRVGHDRATKHIIWGGVIMQQNAGGGTWSRSGNLGRVPERFWGLWKGGGRRNGKADRSMKSCRGFTHRELRTNSLTY